MKDPCEECLVSVMCNQICWDKTNYGSLLKTAINHSKHMINKKTYISKYVNEFLKYNSKYKKHKETLNKIQFRKDRSLMEWKL